MIIPKHNTGLMGKGIYLFNHDSKDTNQNLSELSEDFFFNQDLVYIVEGVFEGYYFLSQDIIGTEGFVLVKQNIPTNCIYSITETNFNGFKKLYQEKYVGEKIKFLTDKFPEFVKENILEKYAFSLFFDKIIERDITKLKRENLESINKYYTVDNQYFKNMCGVFHSKVIYKREDNLVVKSSIFTNQ